MKIYICQVFDSYGNVAEAVVSDPSDTVSLSGLRDLCGNAQYFDSDFYHIGSWADEFGFKTEDHRIDLDLDSKKVAFWGIS